MRKLVLVILGSLLFFSCAMTRHFEDSTSYSTIYGNVSLFNEVKGNMSSNITSAHIGFEAKRIWEYSGLHIGLGLVFPFTTSVTNGNNSISVNSSQFNSVWGLNTTLGPSFRVYDDDMGKIFISPVLDLSGFMSTSKYTRTISCALGLGVQTDAILHFNENIYLDAGIFCGFPFLYYNFISIGNLSSDNIDTHFGIRFVPRLALGFVLE